MSETVLVADDDANVLRLVQYTLETVGYHVVTAKSGPETLSKVQSDKPDLLILDIMMPGMSGIEVCQELRKKPETVSLPIIILSARGEVSVKVAALQVGADEYLTKPIDSPELVARVKALIERTRRLLAQAGAVKIGKVLGFIGAKGGVGTTTVALSIAAALAARGQNVVAAELRSYFGTFSLQLQQLPARNLAGLLESDPERISREELNAHLCSFPFGVKVLFGPQKVSEYRELKPKQAQSIVEGLSSIADYTIIDLPSYLSVAGQTIVQRLNFIALVVEPEPMCVRAGKMVLEMLKTWGASGALVGAIAVNRGALLTSMSLADISAELGCQVIGTVPQAAQACLAAQGAGKPLVLYQPESVVAMNLLEIAQKLGASI